MKYILPIILAASLGACATVDLSNNNNPPEALAPFGWVTATTRVMGEVFYRAEQCDILGHHTYLNRLANTYYRSEGDKQVTFFYYEKAATRDPKTVWSHSSIIKTFHTANGPTKETCDYWTNTNTQIPYAIGSYDTGLLSIIPGVELTGDPKNRVNLYEYLIEKRKERNK